jgi:putative NIF3 family GTP cyclohydrolase 1 type 2
MSASLREIREHLFSTADWVDPEDTVDRIVYGDPERRVEKIGVGWMPCSQNLEAAGAGGCELFISHETFYYGRWAPGLDSSETEWGRRRMSILEKYGMACMNQHDTWDNFPEFGIRDAWRAFVGLGELLEERPYYRQGGDCFALGRSLALSRVEPQTLGEFAASVAERCREFPCFQGVTVNGDRGKKIGTVATGVGCHIPTLEMLELGADVLVLTFDRAMQTRIRTPLTEMGASLLVVEHGVSEMPGMRSMADYLMETFEGVEAAFYCEEPAGETVY